MCLIVGTFNAIAQHSGTVIELGKPSTNVVIIAGQVLTNATAVAIGEAYYLVLKDDGTVVAGVGIISARLRA